MCWVVRRRQIGSQGHPLEEDAGVGADEHLVPAFPSWD
jgi:hypothetical protein